MTRDYAAEMRALMDAEREIPGYASPIGAANIVSKLRANDPELLAGWLDAGAEQILRHALNLIDCGQRTHARTHAVRRAFQRAAEDFAETGDESAVASFLELRFPVEDGSRLTLGEMRRAERRFVADDYDKRAAENAMMAAFIKAIDKKAGTRRTDEVFSNDTLERLWASLAGGKASVTLPTPPAVARKAA